MGKHRWYLSLAVMLLAALVCSAIGCVTLVTPEQEATPSTTPGEPVEPAVRITVNHFAAEPETISAGQTVTLSWDVSGATGVAIYPTVGSAGLSGSTKVAPAITTVYTLTASGGSESDNVRRALTVTVSAPVTGMPDVIITDISFTGQTIYYKVKNQGDGVAKGSRAYLYINGLQTASNYVETLAAGQERLQSFSNYAYNIPVGDPTHKVSTAVKVCADANNEVSESDEWNNCAVVNWGFLYTYDFLLHAHQAEWRSGAGVLKWPMASEDSKGAAFFHGSALATYPEHVSYGWIQGRFAEFYQDEFMAFRSRSFVIPEKTKFIGRVGFKSGAAGTDGVRVTLGWIDATGGIQMLPGMDVYYDNAKMYTYEVDLSDLAGQKTEFVLRVEAKGSWEQEWVLWDEMKLVQQP